MPLYEYTCEACGARFELIRKFSDPPLESCTVCAGGPVHRLPSSPAIQFKGSGFYITDYAKKGQGEGGAGKADKASTEKAQDAKSDAATADRGTDKGADRGTDKGADTGVKADTAAKSTAPAKSDTPAKPSASSPAASGGSKD